MTEMERSMYKENKG